ncbi:hypothetical protein KEJ27_04625 [Candidatus Bathyarchaeota archaeon]|nr:hypothetical protein [Candidatus Bathyarchaeota archaeon]MBS7617676.1 hypothetical protein [Candidatus Bathyarchaeota archaeon]
MTSPVGGIIGYGVIQTKFRQDKPLWPQEVKEGRIMWPFRFEFDVSYCLPQDRWRSDKVVFKKLIPRGFQPISGELANQVIQKLYPQAKVAEAEKARPVEKEASLHEEVKEKLLEIGRLQKMVSESEYDMDGGKLDVVWRRVKKGFPTYVFEIQVGGDLYHAIGKLKHAHDLWNSNIFLITTKNEVAKAQELLSGTFHEIERKIRVIEIEKINELFKLKKAYKDFEYQLGIS